MTAKQNVSSGVIYILTNPSFPEYVKIGYADNLDKRLSQLNRSAALPYAFRAYAVYRVNHRLSDKNLHGLIDRLNPDLRAVETVNGKKRTKEFFAMSAEDAYDILEAIAKISGTEDCLSRVTPTGEEIEEEEQAEETRIEARRPHFKFSMINIKPGEPIAYINDASKVAIVVDDSRVEYDGETTSLSALAKKLTGITHEVQGPLFFTYKGRVLTVLRNEAELAENQ